jgi:hypothetical protein
MARPAIVYLREHKDALGKPFYRVIGMENNVDFDIHQKLSREEVRALLVGYTVKIKGGDR